jgi:beta-lactamase class A
MNESRNESAPPAAAKPCMGMKWPVGVNWPAGAALWTAAILSLPFSLLSSASWANGAAPAKSTAAPVPAAAERSAAARTVVEAQIARIARTSGGEVGVLARHLETGASLALNDGASFPMASTFKIAVAGAVLAQVDAGRLSLQQMIPVDPSLVLSSEGIAETFPFPGVSASVRNLIESMLTHSDNTATNVLTQLAEGPAAVTAWVKSVGVEGMRIDGDTNGIVGRFYGLPPGGEPVEAQLKKLIAANPGLGDMESKPNAAFDDDPRDTATPKAMVLLLSKIVDAHVLSPGGTEVLLGSMERCVTGLKRLRGMLPPGTEVRDKTGTIGGTVNDVGIITLPDGRGRVAIAVFIKKSAKPFEEREQVIAQIARSVYDYMLIENVGR